MDSTQPFNRSPLACSDKAEFITQRIETRALMVVIVEHFLNSILFQRCTDVLRYIPYKRRMSPVQPFLLFAQLLNDQSNLKKNIM